MNNFELINEIMVQIMCRYNLLNLKPFVDSKLLF